jgi:hypothetical protein
LTDYAIDTVARPERLCIKSFHCEHVIRNGSAIDCPDQPNKHFRRFATRYDRRTVHFKGFAYIALP